jgi:flagellar biosynthetic protein FliQ
MSDTQVLQVINLCVTTVIFVAMPPLLMGLSVGLIASIFQTITSIQEATLAFIPKIVAVMVSLIVFGPYMLGRLQNLFITLFEMIPTMLAGG